MSNWIRFKTEAADEMILMVSTFLKFFLVNSGSRRWPPKLLHNGGGGGGAEIWR